MSFSGKVVIVTGSSSGIGAAAAISFAKEGANVVLIGRNKEKLQKVTKECLQTGNEPLSIIAELTNEDDAKRVVSETLKKFGKIDVLVNNAGIVRTIPIMDDSYMEKYDLVINTNLRAPILMTHLTVPHLIETKGNIVNVSSVAGEMTSTGKVSCYAVSKAALNHFTRTAATELAEHGIRVNTVSPGPVKTDIAANAGMQGVSMEDYKDFMPLKRVSDPEEIADLILYIASDKARGITGSNIVTDNGTLLKTTDPNL